MKDRTPSISKQMRPSIAQVSCLELPAIAQRVDTQQQSPHMEAQELGGQDSWSLQGREPEKTELCREGGLELC